MKIVDNMLGLVFVLSLLVFLGIMGFYTVAYLYLEGVSILGGGIAFLSMVLALPLLYILVDTFFGWLRTNWILSRHVAKMRRLGDPTTSNKLLDHYRVWRAWWRANGVSEVSDLLELSKFLKTEVQRQKSRSKPIEEQLADDLRKISLFGKPVYTMSEEIKERLDAKMAESVLEVTYVIKMLERFGEQKKKIPKLSWRMFMQAQSLRMLTIELVVSFHAEMKELGSHVPKLITTKFYNDTLAEYKAWMKTQSSDWGQGSDAISWRRFVQSKVEEAKRVDVSAVFTREKAWRPQGFNRGGAFTPPGRAPPPSERSKRG